MVKAYLSYAPALRCGEIVSSTTPVLALPSAGRAALVAAPAVDAVNVWNLRSSSLVSSFFNRDTRRAGPVTALALARDGATLAAGYSDGSIRLWAMNSSVRKAVASRAVSDEADGLEDSEPEPLMTFNGHRSAISSLCFMETRTGATVDTISQDLSKQRDGATGVGRKRKAPSAVADENAAAAVAPTRLASGSNDGDILLWDIPGEAGLFRLMAHNDVVTSIKLVEYSPAPIIISSSKDGLVRVHDVESQHCVQTIIGHNSEVWAMDLDPSHQVLVTGSIDAELRLFSLRTSRASPEDVLEGSTTDDGLDNGAVLLDIGTVKRSQSAGRVVDTCIRHIQGQTLLCVCSADSSTELFRMRTPAEAEEHRRRRRQRRAEKARKLAESTSANGKLDGTGETGATRVEADDNENLVLAKDFLVSLRSFKTPTPARSVIFADSLKADGMLPPGVDSSHSKTTEVRVIMQLNNNSLELHSIRIAAKKSKKRKKQKHRGRGEMKEGEDGVVNVDVGDGSDDEELGAMNRITGLDIPGHRGDVRAVVMSPDDTTMLSLSRKTAKLWNMGTGKCIRTMTTAGYSMCARFIGHDARFVAVGSKEGIVEVFDLGSGETVASVSDAHGDAIWGMALDNRVYDATTLVTGGADKKVKFWDFSDALTGGDSRSLRLLRTLELPDEVLDICVAYGREKPVLAVALMDSTVRAFDWSSLEPYMNFYGHKMPVLSLDVSSDGLLLATGSADKSVKVWGMDFGDCRRSLRAHDDAVQCVAFQPGTHYLFSGSRDGTLKYWDCDKYEFIASMEGQRGHVWSVAVGDDGELVASGGRDRLLRVWRRTDEQLFLEEEQDRRMDDMFESTLIDEDNKEAHKARSKVVGFMENLAKGEALPAGKRSLETVKAGEKLMEALALADAEKRREAEDPDEAPNPVLLGLAPDMYVLRTLEQIRPAEVDEALTLLPLDQAGVLLSYCARLLAQSCAKARLATELLGRATLFLFKLHHNQIVAGALDRKLVAELRDVLDASLNDLRRRYGFNASALSFWQAELADRDDGTFRDASARAHNAKKARERQKRN